MKKHEKINKLLAGFALGELSQKQNTEIEKHLAECFQCSSKLKQIEALLKHTEHIRELSIDAKTRESAQNAIFKVVESEKKVQPIPVCNISLDTFWSKIMKSKKIRFTAAAVIVIAILGGVTFWPNPNSQNGQWWLGPPAALGQQIIAEMDRIEALVYREQAVFVGRYGSTHVSGTWSRNYEAKDRSRKDRYYEDTDEDTFGDSSLTSVLQHTTYKISDRHDLIQYNVSFEHQCYTIKKIEDAAHKHDPMEKLRFYVSLLDKADRILETYIFDGQECVGFEIETNKYGDNTEGQIDRIWFDVQTKLPVRIEKHGRPITSRPGQTFTYIQDQFEYYAQIPIEMFEPDIPDDFINAEPHEIQAYKKEQEKGKMIYADVPIELRDEIVAVLNSMKTAIYRERFGFVRDGSWVFYLRSKVYVSRYDWRKDFYFDERLRKMECFVTEKDDWGKTSFDFNDENFRLIQTVVNFTEHSYKIISHGSNSHPDNPMDHIIFLAGWIDRADRFLESEQIEGIECFGFELSAKKYGTNPDTTKHLLWFYTETMLPVRMELEWIEDDGPRKIVQDQFEWDVELPEEIFIPDIPADFVPQKSSDD